MASIKVHIMHLWQIQKNKKIWLCNACLRKLTNVVMLGTWQWMDEVNDLSICCDKCKCNDLTADRYGKFRRFFRFFTQSYLRGPSHVKAYRRAIL